MEDQVLNGKTRSIGVSNFKKHHIQQVLQSAKIRPVMNQMERHPYLQRNDLVKYCQSQHIYITAYSPLGNPSWASEIPVAPLLKNKLVAGIAKKHSATPGQILIAYALSNNTIVIPKTTTPARITENFNSLKINLSPEDLAQLNVLDIGLHHVCPDWGPFASDTPDSPKYSSLPDLFS